MTSDELTAQERSAVASESGTAEGGTLGISVAGTRGHVTVSDMGGKVAIWQVAERHRHAVRGWEG